MLDRVCAQWTAGRANAICLPTSRAENPGRDHALGRERDYSAGPRPKCGSGRNGSDGGRPLHGGRLVQSLTAANALALLVFALLASAALTMALLPLLRRHVLAHANARSSHVKATPQGGGIAVIVATIGVTLAFVLSTRSVDSLSIIRLDWVLAATALLVAVGIGADTHLMPVAPRLLLQALAAAIVIAALPQDLRVAAWLPWWIERLLLFVGTLWFVNLVNFMDGIDWMTVAEVVPVSGGLVALGFLGALPEHATIVALALLGAMLGFAPFNQPVARVFLGDAGSLPIGLLLAWLLILLAGRGHLAAALLLPLYYLADTTITLGRRLLNGERVWEAHRTHFYQRATDRGLSVYGIVGRVFAVNVALAILAAGAVWLDSMIASLVALAAGGLLVGALIAALAAGPRRHRS
jgi:UDP-N-acetylmuramyl pentapeptide phosphotransferase/UDP-N-acetylglucosamine-1-phosphate transferase